jgi:calcium-dependent protein kinase
MSNYFCRDLKLDNLLLVSQEENSNIKIIDFGLMVSLGNGGSSVYTDRGVVGTDGFFAPESITSYHYSYKSDVWQAGCILYCMLCGHPAFHTDKKYRRNVKKGEFYPMTGPEWAHISDGAKDLVRNMLTVNVHARHSVDEVLNHPWMRGAAPVADLGAGYKRRVKALALRKTMKKIFMDRDIEDEHRERRSKLNEQFGPSGSGSGSFSEEDLDSPLVVSFRGVEFGSKLKNLKHVLLKNLGVQIVPMDIDIDPCEGQGSAPGLVTIASTDSSAASTSDSSDEDLRILRGEIDVDTYRSMMCSVGLDTLATKEIFNIFDINGDGQIELKEFLLTLMSFRAPDEHDAAVLYFHLFDLNEDGFIDVDELRAVVACLVHDGSDPLLPNGVSMAQLPNVEELFEVIDINPRDGRIDIDEFKQFYHTVLLPTVSSKVSTARVASRPTPL